MGWRRRGRTYLDLRIKPPSATRHGSFDNGRGVGFVDIVPRVVVGQRVGGGEGDVRWVGAEFGVGAGEVGVFAGAVVVALAVADEDVCNED